MTASARYAALSAARTTVLERARDASRVTIPGLIPDSGQNEHTVTSQPYQSVGAHGVRALGARLLLALFPPNLPFFRLGIDAGAAEALGADLGDANMRLASIGQTAHSMMEDAMLRPAMFQVLHHLIVAGNVLLWLRADQPPRVFRLDQYVVKRDSTGQFVTIIVNEKVFPSTLSDEVRKAVGLTEEKRDAEQAVDLFIVVERKGETVEQWQEINGEEVPGSRGKAPLDSCGWLPLRWLAVPGSDYGRAHVTDYIGDLMTLEDNTKAIVEFAAAAARIITIVDPGSGIDIEELASAESGDYVHGLLNGSGEARLKTLQLDKGQDFSVIKAVNDDTTARVASAFLIRNMRDAERVTAEEVRMVAEELETMLGGTYTVLSAELQLPIIRRFLYLGAKTGLIPKLPKDIRPKVVTGFDALGRAAEVNRIRMFLADLGSMLGNPSVMSVINTDELARRLGVGYGVEGLETLLKSAEQRQAEQEQAAMAQAAQIAGPAFAKSAMDAAAQPQSGNE